GLAAASLLACATATVDEDGENLNPSSSDASMPLDPVDAAPGIRPDAGVETADAMLADAMPVEDPADASPSCVTGPINLLTNADFDLGPSQWVESSGGTPTPYALIVSDAD